MEGFNYDIASPLKGEEGRGAPTEVKADIKGYRS